MKNNQFTAIDYDFRPETYWDDADPLVNALVNVKGSLRRATIISAIGEGSYDEQR